MGVSDYISTGALVVSLAGVIVAIVALTKTNRTAERQHQTTIESEKREREAIILIQAEWSGRRKIDAAAITGVGQPEPILPNPSQRFVISGTPLVDDGLVLRPAIPSDDADKDGPGNDTYRALVKIQNIGRWSVTEVTILCVLHGRFLQNVGSGVDDRKYFNQPIVMDALMPNVPQYIEIRNMTGVPVGLDFASVATASDQDIRLVPASRIEFWGRG